jgi:D-aspartate ligase
MSVNSGESNSTKSIGRGSYSGSKPRPGDAARIPAIVVGGTGPGTLGLVRSLGQADIPVILLNENAFAPAMHTRYAQKIVSSAASGVPLVKDLLTLADTIAGPAVLFLNSDDAALTISEYRAQLQDKYLFRLPSHACLTSLMHKTSFQRLAEVNGFPVPRSVTIGDVADLSRLAKLRFPCIVKPSRPNDNYIKGLFPRGYKVSSPRQAEDVCRRILPILPRLIVQEWIEGPDSDLYFCLQYRGAHGVTVCSFTGRKLSIWPPNVGLTASCTAAPDARPILQPLTEAFFQQVSFVGMGGIEFKRNARTGRFLMIEPTVGRIDGQEEIATLYGANIPLAAYFHEIGLPVPRAAGDPSAVIWRDPFLHRRSVRGNRTRPAAKPNIRICDAYWRFDDPIPAFFHCLGEALESLRRTVRRVPFLHRTARSLKRTVLQARRPT